MSQLVSVCFALHVCFCLFCSELQALSCTIYRRISFIAVFLSLILPLFTVEHRRTIEVDSSVTSLTIRNLLPDSEIVRIGVTATNKEDQTGPKIELTGKEAWHQIHAALAIKRDEENLLLDPGAKPVYVQGIKGVYKTLPASQYTKLQRELTRATDSTAKFIDSDFFTVRSATSTAENK